MNQKLLIVLPCCANDGVLTERLLDFIYKIHGKRAIGHLLIVANADLHAEQRKKIFVTAELAFESVTETVAPALELAKANHKFFQLNNLFRHAAKTVQDQCRWPWFWLEPDCVPVAADWISQLADAYENQPKKYMGLISKGKDDKKFMARCGIYYGAASYELDKLCQSDVPFPLATSEKVISSAAATDLIDYLNIETPEDLAKISKSAVIVHGDKMGLFAENWEANPYSSPETLGATLLQSEKDRISREVSAMNLHPAPNSSGAMAMSVTPQADITAPQPPRLTRRQKAEALDKQHKLDCVATEGCKSSIETVTP